MKTNRQGAWCQALARILGAATTLAVCLAGAQTPPDDKGMPPPPPPEALAACKTLSSGAECSVKSPQGTITGSCWAPPGKALACKPKDGPKDPLKGAAPSAAAKP